MSSEESTQHESDIPEGRVDYGEFELPRDLNAFQRDMLFVLASIDDPTGVNVGNALEAMYRKPVNHGQLYPSLDELHEMGLVDKVARDKRTNEYRITRRGRYVVGEYRDFVLGAVPEE
jgi:DNA-binding PadR family transcriptional regulator